MFFRNKNRMSHSVEKRLFFVLVCACSWLVPGCHSRPTPPANRKPITMNVVVTGYCSCGECCNWHYSWWGFGPATVSKGPNAGKRKKVGQTASGVQASPGTIAADTSVIPMGSILYVPGYGYGKVQDRGGAVIGKHIDVWFSSHEQAKKWGKRTVTVKIWKP